MKKNLRLLLPEACLPRQRKKSRDPQARSRWRTTNHQNSVPIPCLKQLRPATALPEQISRHFRGTVWWRGGKKIHQAPSVSASRIQRFHDQETVLAPDSYMFPASHSFTTATPFNLCLISDNSSAAFILYRQHHQQAVVAQNPGLANPEISKIIGDHWRNSSIENKEHWKLLADVRGWLVPILVHLMLI